MPENLLEVLRSGHILLADGGMGTMLQSAGLAVGACNESWNLEHPERIEDLQSGYREAGCQLLTTNTFGGTRLALARHGRGEEVRELNLPAVHIARRVMGPDGWVLGDVGPFGGFLAPLGDADPQEVAAAFLEQASILLEGSVDALILETQTAIEEMQLAVRAARDAGASIVIASFAFDLLPGGKHRTMMGTSPRQACEAMVAAGVDIVGCNCGKDLTIEECAKVVAEYREVTDKPLLAQPNAGQPEMTAEGIVYHEQPQDMAAHVQDLVEAGASIIGGCCGTTPEHIAHFRRALPHRDL